MNKPLSFADVSMLALACGILKDRGAWTVYLNQGVPEVHVGAAEFVTAMQETPATITVKPHGGSGLWRASLTYGGMTLFAIFKRSQLHLVGYQVATPPAVVPLVAEEATA